MPQLGFALIGCGGMGRSEARLLVHVAEAKLVAVCDVQEQAAQAFGQEMGVPAFTDPAQVLARPDVGAVMVTTPNGLHTQLVLDAAAAGKHIFCEKPMAFTVAECDGMIAAAAQHGVRLMVGQVLRLLPLFSRITELFDSGILGRPLAVQISRLGWMGDPAARYRLSKTITGGLLYDITVHEIDLLHRLCGPAISVYAQMDRTIMTQIDYEETALLQLSYRSGAVASLFESVASPINCFRGHIIAEHGALTFDHGAGTLSYRVRGEEQETVTEAVGAKDGENGYLRELRSFTEWVLYDTPPLLTAQEGRAAIAVTEAAYASAQSGLPVEIATA
ncbi:MAG TPA: Gfo/Idh/MocA family oxidoreductase [Chloroflexota bacterium]